jgi:hypothetical protein
MLRLVKAMLTFVLQIDFSRVRWRRAETRADVPILLNAIYGPKSDAGP